MKNIRFDFDKKAIVITKAFAKKAEVFDSVAYNELQRAKKDFPDFSIVVKANGGRDIYKGMDYDFMIGYIEKHDNAETIKEEFNKLRVSGLSFGEIRQWFITKYSVFKNCKTRADWILAA